MVTIKVHWASVR